MRLNYNTTIHLTPDEVTQIIKDHLAKEGFETATISFDVVSEICGYGTSERECINFKGVTARS